MSDETISLSSDSLILAEAIDIKNEAMSKQAVLPFEFSELQTNAQVQQTFLNRGIARHSRYKGLKSLDNAGQFVLPISPQGTRVSPNDFLTTALFVAKNKKTNDSRRYLDNVQLFSLKSGVKVNYSGPELRSDDELVWQEILHSASKSSLGYGFQFNLRQLCLGVGWHVSAKSYDRARACLRRLNTNRLHIDNSRMPIGLNLSLIERLVNVRVNGETNKTSEFMAWIHPNILQFFLYGDYAYLAWDDGYKSITPIARKLYGYAAANKQPFPLSMDNFYSLCGVEYTNIRAWRMRIKQACDELVAAKLLKSAELNGSDFILLVNLEKPPQNTPETV